VLYSTSQGVPESAALNFFRRFEQEMQERRHAQFGREIADVASSIWQSPALLELLPRTKKVEMCSLLNEVLRRDDAVRASKHLGCALK
jgi:hypothetical protein